MKMFARKITFRSLATACLVGTSCCCTLLTGQQLHPVPQALPPNVSGTAAATAGELPPIIAATQMPGSYPDDQLPPIISAAAATQSAGNQTAAGNAVPQTGPGNHPNLPAQHSVLAAMPQTNQATAPPIVQVAATTLPSVGPAASQPTASHPDLSPSTMQKGRNFPTDGERRIAEFIQANNMLPSAISSTAYNSPQADSPSDSSLMPVPVPNIVPSPGSNMIPMQSMPLPGAPSIGGQAAVTGQGLIDYNGSQMPMGAAAGGNYFESTDPYAHDLQAGVSVDYGSRDSTFDCCGFITASRYYGIFDALYWSRNDGVFRASNISTIGDYDFNAGARITLGKKRDSTRGFEVSYMQLDPLITSSTQATQSPALIGALFPLSQNNLPNDAFTAFRNGTYAQQWHKTQLHSLEVNRTWWGSDVAKAFWGLRYIDFQDDFRLSMANAAGESGYHQIRGENQLFGAQGGMEILYDIGYRLSFSYGAKIGGYANAASNTVQHINAGAIRGFNNVEQTEFAWNAEFGIWGRYKLTPNIRFRAGYEVFALFNIYDAESMFSPRLGNVAPLIENSGDALFHGPSVGFEIYR